MGRNAKREAVVKLREQIAACEDDPKLLVQLTRQLAKLSPKQKGAPGRPRNETPTRKTLAKDAAALSTYVRNGSAMDDMPLRERAIHRLVLAVEAENRRRGFAGEPPMTEAEQGAVIEETRKGFAEVEQNALEAEFGEFRPRWEERG